MRSGGKGNAEFGVLQARGEEGIHHFDVGIFRSDRV